MPLLKIHPPAERSLSVDVLHVVPSLIAHHSDWTLALACIFCDMWDVAIIGSCVLLSPGHSRLCPMWPDQARRRGEKTGADGDICDGGVMV